MNSLMEVCGVQQVSTIDIMVSRNYDRHYARGHNQGQHDAISDFKPHPTSSVPGYTDGYIDGYIGELRRRIKGKRR